MDYVVFQVVPVTHGSSTRLPRHHVTLPLLAIMLVGQFLVEVGAQNLDAAIDPDPTIDQLTGDNLATGTHGTLLHAPSQKSIPPKVRYVR